MKTFSRSQQICWEKGRAQPANVLNIFYSCQSEEYNKKENAKLLSPLAKENWDKEYIDLPSLNMQVYLFISCLGSKSEAHTIKNISKQPPQQAIQSTCIQVSHGKPKPGLH